MEEKNIKVVVLAGKARSGKDTTASYMKEYLESINKKVVLLSYASYIKMYAKEISDWDGRDETKPRSLLQELGTDIIRKKIDNNFFINRIIDDIKVYNYFFDYAIITDARMEDEIINIKNVYERAVSVKINRTNYDSGLNENEQKHLTETGLDNFSDYDYIINNESTLEELRNKAVDVIKKIEGEVK